ncbi:nuclear pore complex assembly protein [Fusarium austroafricanum]|uniref:Nuclear pore complex assembly protein n=1 Tax=Fusarium austroafricanum TaxID=2364996 RepID=A0A8H4P267_9HYPO|nr:nuclear pore complex assembly protein [Fusarium austroafricanum]
MFDYTNIHDVFAEGLTNPYDRDTQREIDTSRKNFDNALFIDRVLRAVGITKAKIYPPKTDNALKQLHQQICEATMSTHHKFSIFYYILLDFDRTAGRESVSDAFVDASGMPKKYQIFMKGLWYLDHQDFSRALEYISHPSLIPDFADDIITVLVRSAEDHDYSIALSYFYAVQPILKTSTALELLFDAMANTNISEALFYSRTHPHNTRELLFRQLIAVVLNSSNEELSERAGQLAFLPFDKSEETWFEEYLLHGNGKNHKKAKDTLVMRKIASDQFSEVAKIRHGGHWSAVLEGIKGGISGHSE